MSLTLESVSRRVNGVSHLDDISLSFEPGELNVLLGHAGAGKTSLLRAIAGLDPPDAGRVVLDEADITNAHVRERNVAFVYEAFVNYPHMSVFENIATPLRLGGLDAHEIQRRVEATASALGLTDLLDRRPDALSGGQQQRTALARALARDARLLLLDEPLANLDYKLRESLRTELRDLIRAKGAIAIYATSDPDEALVLGGRAVVMHEGRVLQQGETLAVFREPVDVTAARLFSDPPMNILPGSLDAGHLRLDCGLVVERPRHARALADGRYRIGIRPRHVLVERADDVSEARVALSEISGSETFVHIDIGEDEIVCRMRGIHPFEVDDPALVRLAADRAYFFAESQHPDNGATGWTAQAAAGADRLLAAPSP